MPVVPEIDVDGACHADDEHDNVDAKAYGDDERPHGAGIRDGRGRRPAKIEERKIELVQLRHSLEGRAEIGREQRRHDAKPDKAHTDKKTALHGLCRLDSYTHPEHGKDDRHHDRRAKPDNVCKCFFHCLSNL